MKAGYYMQDDYGNVTLVNLSGIYDEQPLFIDKLKKVNLIQFVPAIFVISLVGNSVFGYTAPKAKSQKNAGVNQVEAATTAEKKKAKKANAGDIDLSKIKDGTYEGQANGYRGLVKVSVTVKDHKITAIKVLSNSDDAAFFNRASAGVIKNILAKQSLKVDVVSGATYSSNGIIKAVKNALTGEEDKTAAKASGSSKSAGSVGTADESGTYKDGTFTGSASGYHGTVKVSVTIKNNKIKSIKILENHDDAAYFNRAKGILLPLMIKKQSTNVDSVSGATFSSNGIIKAVHNALKKAAVKGSSSSLDSESNSNSTAKKDTTDNVTGVYKDGVYEGTGKGFRGNIIVSVRIKKSKIVEIKLVKNEKDDAAYFNKAWSEVPYSIIAMQTANTDKVDAVSGATYSSNGIMEAVRNALKKAVAKKDSTNSNTSNSNNNNSNNSNNNNNNTSKDDNTTTPSTPVEEEDKIYEGSAVCEPDEDEEFDAYKLTLEVVISADNKVKNIQNIKWSDRYMSAWYNMAQKTMVPKLISYGFEIPEKYDTVSGATCSSNALVKAYKDAISKINK